MAVLKTTCYVLAMALALVCSEPRGSRVFGAPRAANATQFSRSFNNAAPRRITRGINTLGPNGRPQQGNVGPGNSKMNSPGLSGYGNRYKSQGFPHPTSTYNAPRPRPHPGRGRVLETVNRRYFPNMQLNFDIYGNQRGQRNWPDLKFDPRHVVVQHGGSPPVIYFFNQARQDPDETNDNQGGHIDDFNVVGPVYFYVPKNRALPEEVCFHPQ